MSKEPVIMICTVMPAGLEDFFKEVGRALPSRDSEPLAPTEEDKKRMISLASKYKLDINFQQ